MNILPSRLARAIAAALIAPLLAFGAAPAAAQMQTIDPDTVIDGDLIETPAPPQQDYDDSYPADAAGPYETQAPDQRYESQEVRPSLDLPENGSDYSSAATDAAVDEFPPEPAPASAEAGTYREDDLIGAAEGLFGRGAEGLARLIQDILADQGEPNGYIVGREGGGAFILGVRYGSGTLYHAVEGNMPVYWTGPSIGLDAGANAGNTFVLVYNLYDTDELYERYPAGEGQAYFVGGFTASYVRKGDVVLIPIRVGAGLRLGINAGYMRFSREQRWLPF
ncbi:DUF1134 domain-containing protein [Aurantiacibacter aquimixticola]|uniref:DUF1134 domain-containing protein n=2 Tax=Aurantiacibacter aquimixticola TaxID=1958945 RepID=A0A419RX78_9SPHN|nr:DUF1134 domain-containing protein [Aurantiacibacter aquimixticola]